MKKNQMVTPENVNNLKETTTNKKHVINYWRNQATKGEHLKNRKYKSIIIIGASLSEPHTSVTACAEVVCMSVCLRPYTMNFKWVNVIFHENRTSSGSSVVHALVWRKPAHGTADGDKFHGLCVMTLNQQCIAHSGSPPQWQIIWLVIK